MTTKSGRLFNSFQGPESILCALSLAAAATTLLTFYDWAFLWGWNSPLIFSMGLLIATLALYPDKWWGHLLAALLTLLIVYDLSRDMLLEWREYWFAGAGLKDSTGQAPAPNLGADTRCSCGSCLLLCNSPFGTSCPSSPRGIAAE